MDEVHRDLIRKRQRYLQENVIMEEGLVNALKDKGVFTANMANAILAEKDPDKQMQRMLDMIPKRGPEAYSKLLECLEDDYPWVVENFKEKETELVNSRGKMDILPELRRTIKEYIKDLAKTTRINQAQQKAVEEFLCRHIVIDSNLNNPRLHGRKLFSIHKQLLSAIHVNTLDESDQMSIKEILPENVTIDKIEKEITLLCDRVNDLQSTLDTCYEKIGETNREKELPDLIYTMRKLLLEKEIRIEEIKNQLLNQTRAVRLAKDRTKKALDANQKIEEEKEELEKSLESLKTKIQKLQEERQRIGMKIAFDSTYVQLPSTPSSRTKSSKRPDDAPTSNYRRGAREEGTSARTQDD